MITIAKIFCHGLLIIDGKLLILQRGNNKVYPNLWDLPGGFKEENENFKDCVIREFKEETGLSIEVEELIDIKSQLYNDEIIIVLFYQVKTNDYNIILNKEHINYEYVDDFKNKDLIWYLKGY